MVPGLLIVGALASSFSTANLDAAIGQALFERRWVSAPSTTRADEGLGPLYDARSCNACHAGGGPGRISQRPGEGLVVRLGEADGRTDPTYGAQLQTHALPELAPEASVSIAWQLRNDRRTPVINVSNLAYGSLEPHTHIALRRAPALFGAAELAAISDTEILAMEAREHRHGLRGHAALLRDENGLHVGRWGWKATTADLETQISLALERDIGLSTPSYPDPAGECTNAETACRDLAHEAEGAKIEVSGRLVHLIAAYVSSLPSPAPPKKNPAGQAVFERVGCGDCHASFTGMGDRSVNAGTDLLLHNLGPGLDDGIADGDAKSAEWRTAPLWNLADELAAGGLLHDGRARSIAEAVSWHGGEAAAARRRFVALSRADKAALEDYLLGK